MKNKFLLSIFVIALFTLLSNQVFAASPIAHWRFDEGSGTTATDSSSNNNDGTINGATYSTTTPEVDFANPYSLEFDGVNDGVSTPLSLNNMSEFTLAGWAYPRSAQSNVGWFGANDVFEFIFENSTTLRCWTSAAAVEWSFEGDEENFLDSWHHITCLGNGESVIMYIDGAEVASTTHEFTDNYGTGDNFSIGIGVQDGGMSGPFDGFIDDVRVYDVALTPQQMSSLGSGDETPPALPQAVSFFPAVGSTDISINTNLEIEFDMEVGWDGGEVLIKKVEDGTIFETIVVGGGPVSGSGSDTLVVNPSNTFEYSTEYYIEIPDTAIRDIESAQYFQGLSGTTTWSFMTEDEPIVDDEEVEEVEVSKTTRKKGTSVSARVNNLIARGDASQANELMVMYPNLFRVVESAKNVVVSLVVRDLFVGITGDDVKALQSVLIDQGYSIPAGATGYFGTQTQFALSQYQLSNSISPSLGYFGPITRNQMKISGLSGLWW